MHVSFIVALGIEIPIGNISSIFHKDLDVPEYFSYFTSERIFTGNYYSDTRYKMQWWLKKRIETIDSKGVEAYTES